MELPTILTMELSSAKNREKAKHKFKEFLAENGVKHIVARINHPQTNGKLHLFNSIKEFVYWYNFVKPHMSLNFEELETPHLAF